MVKLMGQTDGFAVLPSPQLRDGKIAALWPNSALLSASC